MSFLQVAWAIEPTFIIWNLWLERNQRVFYDNKLEGPQLWQRIICRLWETIVAKCDLSESVDPGDFVIVQNLNLGDSIGDCPTSKKNLTC